MNANGHSHSDHWPPTSILQSPHVSGVTRLSPLSESSGRSGQHQLQKQRLDNPFSPCGVSHRSPAVAYSLCITAECLLLNAQLTHQEAIPDHISPAPLESTWLTFCFSGSLPFLHGRQSVPRGPLIAHALTTQSTHLHKHTLTQQLSGWGLLLRNTKKGSSD